ncbi:AAA family ATPase [Rhabdochromatium marinum]|uniref:nSTAND1 domain-containing NTPase n=1 Tax=Rhabdochromatium marinum TaxID=48729 RepID=UPI00190718C6|nr:AAA family ATPase [Rhabdochromatium marinum]MBK1648240.1 hypothetical protein [Rhabdochromatium marinum]
MKDDQVRIFVSSPTDVDHERMIVKDVIERLAQDYLAYFPLRAILWEEEALTADRTFQAGLTQPSECDIVLVILWTRLGSPLPDDPYQGMTGTEWEFVDAVESFQARGRPEVLVYKKAAPKLVDITHAESAQEAMADRRRLEDFFRAHFFNEDQTFRRAFRTFDSDAQFRELVEVQLRKLLNRRISAERRTAAGEHQWHGSPFRAGQPFEPSDERVFTGREAELRELIERIEARADSGAALVLLSGPSGSGKTSLLRAGLLPKLTRPFRFQSVASVRTCLVSPPSAAENPLATLATALGAATCLGDPLRGFGLDAPALATLLASDPALATRQLIAALREAARTQMLEEPARLAVMVDPLDALFAPPDHTQATLTTDQEAVERHLQHFAAALVALARSGDCWVIVAMRSDALCQLARLPALAALLDESGWQRLEPVPSARIRQIIEIPTRIAGIELDAQVSGPGHGLVERIEAEADTLRHWAPPLQALLHTAYLSAVATAGTDQEPGRLSIEPWRAPGGLAGQMLEQAEAVWRAGLDPQARAALPRLCRALISLGHEGQALARAGDLRVLEQDPSTWRLLAALIEARVLTAEAECDPSRRLRCEHPDYSLRAALAGLWRHGQRKRSGDAAAPAGELPAASVETDDSPGTPAIDWSRYAGVVQVSHPVLLSHWEPIRAWLGDPEHRALLRLRESLTRQAHLWKRTSCNREYLFGAAGYAAAQRFAARFPDELEPLEREFLQQSGAYLAFVRRRNLGVRAFGVVLILLLLTASTAAWIAQRKSEKARLAMHQVQLKEADLQSRGGNTPQAVAKALAAGVDLPAEAVRTLSEAFSRNRLLAMTAAPSSSLERPLRPAANAAGDRLATLQPGQGARYWRLSAGRVLPADPPVLSDGRLGIHSLVMALPDDLVFGIAEAGVYRLPAAAGDPPSYPCGTTAGAVVALDPARQRLALATPAAAGHQGVCVLDLTQPGRVLFQQALSEQALRGLSFAPDGQALLTASTLGRTHLIDLAGPEGTASIRLSLPRDGPLGRPFNQARFDPSGQRIGIAAADEQVRLFERDGREIGALNSAMIDGQPVRIHNSAVRDLAFAPDGRALVAVDDEGQVVRWSLTDPPQAVVLGQHELSIVSVAVGDPNAVRTRQNDVARAPNTLVLTASLDGTARLWSLATGKPLAVFGHDGALNWARFADASQRVLSFSQRDASLRLWSVQPVSRLAFELRHADPANHVWHLDTTAMPPALLAAAATEPSGPSTQAPVQGAANPFLLATAGYDGQVQVWRYDRDGEPPHLSYRFAQQEETPASGASPEAVRPVRRVQFSPSGRRLAAARFDGSARVHDLLTGRSCRLQVMAAHATQVDAPSAGKVFQVLFAPDERWLLTTSDDTTRPVRLFDPRVCVPIDGIPVLEQPGAATEAAAVRQLGADTLVAVGDEAGEVRLLRANPSGAWREHCAMSAEVGAISALAIAPDGRTLAIAGEDSRLGILSLEAEGCGRLEYGSGHSDRLYSVAFSPDGTRILTASLDKTARLWTSAGQPLAVLRGHQDRIYSASFSPGDGRWLLTASRDGSLRVWRSPSADEPPGVVRSLRDFLPLQADLGGAAFAGFSPSGRYVAGAYWDNAALLWRMWREDDPQDANFFARWGQDRARLALLKEAYRFRRDNQVSETTVQTETEL